MDDFLYMKLYNLPVFEDENPDYKTDADWILLHRQACGLIRQGVRNNVLNHISGKMIA